MSFKIVITVMDKKSYTCYVSVCVCMYFSNDIADTPQMWSFMLKYMKGIRPDIHSFS